MVSYSGQPFPGNLGYKGKMEDVDFIKRFQPVDPVDLLPAEHSQLLSFCNEGTTLKIGFIQED
jgi:hypothetical protein